MVNSNPISLQEVIEVMDLIKKEVVEIKEKMGVKDQPRRRAIPAGRSSRSPLTGQNVMESLDDVLEEILDKLIGGRLDCRIIPIIGMGGIGKTTVAHNIYVNPLIGEYFDICAWATISQEFSMREFLREVLSQGIEKERGNSRELTENELGVMLYKHLSGRRYLIVMDDMWNIEAWDEIKFFFPDNNNGSRIIITTRLSNVASQLSGSNYRLEMKLLDEVRSWNLFCKTVFGEEGCPLYLEQIGKRIVKNCRGLPLSIIVIGRLLARTQHTPGYWLYIENNLNSVLNLEDDQYCSKILYMSYNQLPVHLKPCFLYMGVFQEDRVICTSMLVKLWAAEGFLKPIKGKMLEEVAEEYLKDLIDRNLLSVHKLGSIGNIKECKIHDLLRELCLREAQEVRFYNVIGLNVLNISQGLINNQRRITLRETISGKKGLDDLQSMSLARSLICDNVVGVQPSLNLRLLRIWKTFDKTSSHLGDSCSVECVPDFVNLRYIAIRTVQPYVFNTLISHLWNLHTLSIDNYEDLFAPIDLWSMPLLRHVEFRSLKFLLTSCRKNIVLGNLQTLGTVKNFSCTEEMSKRIPNIKKLRISNNEYWPWPRSNNFALLCKLESFCCSINEDLFENLSFPHSLKKMTLEANSINCEYILEKLGSLPSLEKLKLFYGSFRGGVWRTVEGQFCSLKYLQVSDCNHLKNWETESTHFPRLEHLVLTRLPRFEEIPSDIGEIPTLQSIDLKFCNKSVVLSAKMILEEQEELGEEGLKVRVILLKKDEELHCVPSRNFQIEYGF